MRRFPLRPLGILLIVAAPLLAHAETDAAHSHGTAARPAGVSQTALPISPRLTAVQNQRGTPTKQVMRPALTPEQRAIDEIQVDGRSRVAELARQIETTSDETERNALQLRAVEIKRETRVRMLRVMVSFARNRGDVARTSLIESQIETIVHPQSKASVNTQSAAKKAGQ